MLGNFDEDILAAGRTAFDADRLALDAIMAEWTSNRTFQQRTDNLQGAGSGSSWLNRANGNVFLIADAVDDDDITVFDDASSDLLVGGLDRDWFFANLSGSGVRDCIADAASRDLADDLALIDCLDQ